MQVLDVYGDILGVIDAALAGGVDGADADELAEVRELVVGLKGARALAETATCEKRR